MSKRISGTRELADAFRTLLTEHFALVSKPATSNETEQFKEVIEGFENAYEVATVGEGAEAKIDRDLFETFFPDYDRALERWRQEQEGRADDFNLLDVMQLTWKEICHSRILAWLLDWDMTRLGTHAQGKLGFRLFLDEVRLPASYATEDYHVHTESSSDESRIDIEVASPGRFVIHVENKIRSGEGCNQTAREWRDLEKSAATLGCVEKHALYLTPRGVAPGSQDFRPISWRQIARVFEKFADAAKPDDVNFARHYAKVVKTNIILAELDDEENDDGNGPVQ